MAIYRNDAQRGDYETQGNIRGNEDASGAPMGLHDSAYDNPYDDYNDPVARTRQDLQGPMRQDAGGVPRGYGGYAGGNVRANQGYNPGDRPAYNPNQRSSFTGTPGTFGGGEMGGYGGDARDLRNDPRGHSNARYPERGYETERAGGYRDDAFMGQSGAGRFYGPGQMAHSDYSGYGSFGGQAAYGDQHHDPDYHQLRQEHARALDEDYRAWRNERQGKFSSEFSQWRQSRKNNPGDGSK